VSGLLCRHGFSLSWAGEGAADGAADCWWADVGDLACATGGALLGAGAAVIDSFLGNGPIAKGPPIPAGPPLRYVGTSPVPGAGLRVLAKGDQSVTVRDGDGNTIATGTKHGGRLRDTKTRPTQPRDVYWSWGRGPRAIAPAAGRRLSRQCGEEGA
jgi:hypothetical protein